MFSYLVQRLLWVIPVLWFIASVVFILMKLIPGNAASLLDDETTARISSKNDIYQQYLERTGQHLPLLYIRLRSAAEPDTLIKVKSHREQKFLRKMALQYGNWPLIANYYIQLKKLKEINLKAPEASYQQQLSILFTSTDKTTIEKAFASIHTIVKQHKPESQVLQTLQTTLDSFTTLTQHQLPYKKYIPVFSWYGSQNQYHHWLSTLVRGDLGISLRDARPVTQTLAEAISNTFLLSVCSLLMVFSIAILLSLLIVHKDYQFLRKPVLNVLYVVDTIPVFMLALLLLILLASSQYLALLPVYGLGNVPEEANWLKVLSVRLYHLIMPVICLTLGSIPYVTSQLYAAMREVTEADFVQTARAKGIAEGLIVSKHILRNALLPIITLFSGFIPALLGGAVVIEVIFAIPGMGQLLVDSVLARDYPVILGIVLVMGLAKIMAHILADILYYVADPRIRFL
jgi:peptide/nickel transport system permease protein